MLAARGGRLPTGLSGFGRACAGGPPPTGAIAGPATAKTAASTAQPAGPCRIAVWVTSSCRAGSVVVTGSASISSSRARGSPSRRSSAGPGDGGTTRSASVARPRAGYRIQGSDAGSIWLTAPRAKQVGASTTPGSRRGPGTAAACCTRAALSEIPWRGCHNPARAGVIGVKTTTQRGEEPEP